MKNSNRGAWLICAATCWPVSQAWADAPATQPADRYLEAVRTFADNALQYGRDTYGPKHTPLFADGLNVDTHEPPIWELPRENAENWKMPRRWIMCNVASQQNFYRTLVALSELTRDPRYRQAAVDSLRYAFAHLRHESGLMFWGGHAAWDLDTDQPVGESRTDGIAGRHEFKRSYPFYELIGGEGGRRNWPNSIFPKIALGVRSSWPSSCCPSPPSPIRCTRIGLDPWMPSPTCSGSRRAAARPRHTSESRPLRWPSAGCKVRWADWMRVAGCR